MTDTRMVKCSKLGKELPGVSRRPYKNELGQRIYDNVSQEAWDMWVKDSVKYINTYRVDLTSAEGQKFMFDQAEVYFGFKDGKLADTAFVPGSDEAKAHDHSHDGHGHDGHSHD